MAEPHERKRTEVDWEASVRRLEAQFREFLEYCSYFVEIERDALRASLRVAMMRAMLIGIAFLGLAALIVAACAEIVFGAAQILTDRTALTLGEASLSVGCGTLMLLALVGWFVVKHQQNSWYRETEKRYAERERSQVLRFGTQMSTRAGNLRRLDARRRKQRAQTES